MKRKLEKQLCSFDFLPFLKTKNISVSGSLAVTCLLTADYWPFMSRLVMETLNMGVSALWQGVEL